MNKISLMLSGKHAVMADFYDGTNVETIYFRNNGKMTLEIYSITLKETKDLKNSNAFDRLKRRFEV